VLLAVALMVTKKNDAAALDTATSTITDFSNRLDTAQVQIVAGERSLITLSNALTESSVTLSNQLTQTIGQQTEQLAALKQQATAAGAEKAALNADLLDLTNQLTALNEKIAATETSLTQTNLALTQLGEDYQLLQNRLQRDVAERLVAERKFRSATQIEAQLQKLNDNPPPVPTTGSIYTGLDVEIRSNGVAHVIAPD
jgi:chromosome segregation ATPase